jgi:RimJ/RimL family protein N-acetyltransferase
MGEGGREERRGLLRGERVDIRPVEYEDLPLIHRWEADPAMSGDYIAPAPVPLAQLQKRFSERPGWSDEYGRVLAVRKDGTPVGLLSYHRVSYGMTSPAFNIGIGMAPEHRGQGYGSEAQQLLADYLLFTYPVGRVEASTDVKNIGEQRALERAGFVREGVARSAHWRESAWHDMVVYSRIRSDQ